MCAPEGNSEFCFPESLNVSRDEVEGELLNANDWAVYQIEANNNKKLYLV